MEVLSRINRRLESNVFLCLPAFIIKFILFGVIGTPLHIVRCFFFKNPHRDTDFDDRPCNGRWDSETCCIPLKSNCAPNGRNVRAPDGTRRFMYLPFGLTEIGLAVCGVAAFWYSYYLPGAPIAWHTAGRINVRPGALQDPADYTWILGNYEAYKNKLVISNSSMEWKTHDAIVFALWDKFHLPAFDPKPNDAVSQAAFKAQSGFIALNVSDPTAQHYTWEKAPITGIAETFDDVIVYSNNCFCRGVYPEGGYMTKMWCKKQAKAGNCKPLSGGTLMPLADMAMQVRLCTQQQWLEVHQWPRWFVLTAVLARLWYVFYCPRHLTMPGTQWMHPFWTGVAGYILRMHAIKMRSLLTTKPIYGLPSKWGIYLVPPMLFKGGKFGGPYHGFNHPTATIYKHLEWQVWWSAALVIASGVCMLLSQYAYCTDCTHYSMLEDNLNLLKKKAADRVAKKNSIVFGRKTM